MLKKVIVIYDNSIKPDSAISSITGEKPFGSVIFKRKTLKERTKEEVEQKGYVESIIDYQQGDTVTHLMELLAETCKNHAIVHLYANYGIRNKEDFGILLDKAQFINKNIMVVSNDRPCAGLFKSVDDYLEFLKDQTAAGNHIAIEKMKHFDQLETGAFADLSNFNYFLQFMTGGFDARFFNALEGDEYTVTKKSVNKIKIKSEYTYFHLLPQSMQMWFVQPFDYTETDAFASYTMERYHMTDIAIRFVHGAIDLEEFEDILRKLFYFITHRHKKEISKEEYERNARSLFLDKLDCRMEDLKKSPYYTIFDQFIASGSDYNSIDDIINRYKQLYEHVRLPRQSEQCAVIGHGDLCFSNILYSKETSMLKLIDPKGAIYEEDLWTNPYYDLAKLSHSICGHYDFFNSGLFDIRIEADMKLKLSLEFDNKSYTGLFRSYLEQYGFSYPLVRLYEASLFLSMLPLHMDNVQKVFGFLLNAVNILEEVEVCLKE